MLQLTVNKINLLKEQQKQKNQWSESVFYTITQLSADYIGKVGEEVIVDYINNINNKFEPNWEVTYYGDANVNPSDGTYDFAIKTPSKKYRIGVKTSRLGGNNGFQHDGLHNNECDIEILFDIDPENRIFITMIDFKNYVLEPNKKHEVFGISPHLRKNTENNYKLDLKVKHLKKGVKSGITLEVTESMSIDVVYNFFKKFII